MSLRFKQKVERIQDLMIKRAADHQIELIYAAFEGIRVTIYHFTELEEQMWWPATSFEILTLREPKMKFALSISSNLIHNLTREIFGLLYIAIHKFSLRTFSVLVLHWIIPVERVTLNNTLFLEKKIRHFIALIIEYSAYSNRLKFFSPIF